VEKQNIAKNVKTAYTKLILVVGSNQRRHRPRPKARLRKSLKKRPALEKTERRLRLEGEVHGRVLLEPAEPSTGMDITEWLSSKTGRKDDKTSRGREVDADGQ